MSHALVSFTEEDARSELFAIPTQLDDALLAGNTAVQLIMFALDLTDENKTNAMQEAKKALFRAAALLTREIEGVR